MILWDASEEFDILVKNGMFRNRDPPDLSKPISGSNADGASWDRDEYVDCAEKMGLKIVPVHTDYFLQKWLLSPIEREDLMEVA